MFEHYLQPVIHYLHQHPGMAQLFAFIIAFAESLPIIGTIIPGSVTMTAVGALIGAAIIPGLSTFIWAAIGAFCGDSLGYFIGFKYYSTLKCIWPFTRYPKWITKSEEFFERHGGKSIIIGRFVGPARSMVPMVAGLMRLPLPRFVLAALPSAIMWAILYMVPGILLGALSLELPPHKATEFILIGLGIIIALWLFFWLIQYFFKSIIRGANYLIDTLWDWLNRHHSSQFFIKLITNRQNPKDHHQLALSFLSIVSALLFLLIFASVITHGALLDINTPLFHFFQSLHTLTFNRIFILITLLGKPFNMMIIGVLGTLILAVRKQWRAATHLLLVVILSAGATQFFKLIYYSPRPTGFYIIAKSSSFPSGHALLSLTIPGFLGFLSAQLLDKKWRWIPYTLAAITTTLVACSRLYLGAHWFTDILGSVTLGLCILMLMIVSYRRMPKALGAINISKAVFFPVLLVCISFAWGRMIYIGYTTASYRYTPLTPTLVINKANWWQHPLTYLPLYRNNRFGHPIEPFNLQWSDKLLTIKQRLIKQGWSVVRFSPTVKNTLQRFASYNPKFHMPVLPLLYQNRAPALVMAKKLRDSDSLMEIRLWRSFVSFQNTHIPLWIGSFNLHTAPKKLLTLRRRYEVSFATIKRARNTIHALNHYQTKVIHIPKIQQPKKVQRLNWDGYIMIIAAP